jgi:CRP/FNR family transcriptional regulator
MMSLTTIEREGCPSTPEPVAKGYLRGQLTQSAGRLGLTTSAIERFVECAQLTHWRAGQRIYGGHDVEELTNFVVSGVVRIGCAGQARGAVTVQLVRPGRFFGLTWPFEDRGPRQFSAVAHVPSLVAMVSRDVMATIVAGLPPSGAQRLIGYSWRSTSRLLLEKCRLLRLPLRDRVIEELRALARDFGKPIAGGILIDVPLTHLDVAELVAATRSNVSRCLGALRRSGRVEMMGHRIVLIEPRVH